MPTNHFDSLLAELDAFAKAPRVSDADRKELAQRRGADSQILKAIEHAGRIIKEKHEVETWARGLMAKSAARASTRAATANTERSRLAKSIEMGTAMLKEAVSEGRLSALEACKYEAAIHRLNERLGAMQ